MSCLHWSSRLTWSYITPCFNASYSVTDITLLLANSNSNIAVKMTSGTRRDGSSGRSTGCSSRQPQFNPQHSRQMAHNNLEYLLLASRRTHTHMHTRTHAHTHVHTHTRAHSHTCTLTHVHSHTCTLTQCTLTHVHSHTCTLTHAHSYTCTLTHAHIYSH